MATYEIVSEGRKDPLKIIEAGENLSGYIADTTRGIAVATKVQHHCDRGCSWCCHMPVSALIPEVLAIAEHLRQTRTAVQIDDLRAKLREQVDGLKGLPDIRPLRQTCVLLEEGKCSIYGIRPGACAGYWSTDSDQCERFYNHPEAQTESVLVFGLPITTAILSGARGALHKHRLDSESVLLSAGLLIALDNPDAAKDYLDGKPVFHSAHYGCDARHVGPIWWARRSPSRSWRTHPPARSGSRTGAMGSSD
jgi:Fe-S-cluster containining protein